MRMIGNCLIKFYNVVSRDMVEMQINGLRCVKIFERMDRTSLQVRIRVLLRINQLYIVR